MKTHIDLYLAGKLFNKTRSGLLNIKEKIYRYLFVTKYTSKGKLKFILANHPDPKSRLKALSMLGATIGEKVHINQGARIIIDRPREANLILGSRVAVAPNVTFVCNSGPCHSNLKNEIEYVREHLVKASSIVIEEDCWIGTGAVLLPGVHLGKGVIVGANSVITADCEPYTVWAGVPARCVRHLK